MGINFNNLEQFEISFSNFCEHSRFELEDFDEIPEIHLNQIKPLSLNALKFISEFLSQSKLHKEIPFQKGLFRKINKAKIIDGNEREIRKWLYHRRIPFSQKVILYIDQENALIMTWKMFIKYFTIFNLYNDDITIFCENLEWAILVYHEGEIYFGTNKEYAVLDSFSEHRFSW